MNLCPRDIMTREAFENAITVVMALGGSTNAVLHLLAMAYSAGVVLKIDDFLLKIVDFPLKIADSNSKIIVLRLKIDDSKLKI